LSTKDARIQVKRSLSYKVPRACLWVSTLVCIIKTSLDPANTSPRYGHTCYYDLRTLDNIQTVDARQTNNRPMPIGDPQPSTSAIFPPFVYIYLLQ